jgi:hypothetical protein
MQKAFAHYTSRVGHSGPQRRASHYRKTQAAVIIHMAAQSSHDLASKIPFDDFDVNAVGTPNLFEAARGHQFGGINPSILKALVFGNLVLALNTLFNVEVLDNGKYSLLYEKMSRTPWGK